VLCSFFCIEIHHFFLEKKIFYFTWFTAEDARACVYKLLCRFLSTESEQLIWKSEGLPSDELSMENAMVILQVNTVAV